MEIPSLGLDAQAQAEAAEAERAEASQDEQLEKTQKIKLEQKPMRPDFGDIGAERAQKARERVFSFKESIKTRFINIFSRVKGVSKDALNVVLASPEIVKYGKDAADFQVNKAYEAVADKVVGGVKDAGGFVAEDVRDTIEDVKNKYNALEQKAVGVAKAFTEKVEEIKRKREEKLEAEKVKMNVAEYRADLERAQAVVEKLKESAAKLKIPFTWQLDQISKSHAR